MTRPRQPAPLDPERGRAVAADLRTLGAKKILIRAAEQGYITELACKMPTCFCPEELGGPSYFEPVTAELRDWMPTHEHFRSPSRTAARKRWTTRSWGTACATRIDYSIRVGRSHARDLERIRRAREEAVSRNRQQRED
jgi:hypothetical protein